MITIRNIVLKDLIEVLNSMPPSTKMVKIEYTEHNSKMVVYPSEGDEETSIEDNNPDTDPHIDPDDDIVDYV